MQIFHTNRVSNECVSKTATKFSKTALFTSLYDNCGSRTARCRLCSETELVSWYFKGVYVGEINLTPIQLNTKA
jgi:hypothetical protein